jgi:hypothetical protein
MYILTYKDKLRTPEDQHLLALINPPNSGMSVRLNKVEVFSVGNAEFRVKLTNDTEVKGRKNATTFINSVSGDIQTRALAVVDLKDEGLDDGFLKIKTCFVNGDTRTLIAPDDNFTFVPGTAIIIKVASDNRFTMIGCNLIWEEIDMVIPEMEKEQEELINENRVDEEADPYLEQSYMETQNG